MENLEQNQPQLATESQVAGEEPIPEEPIPEVKSKISLLLPILLSLVMFLLGGVVVFAYFVFLRPEKVVPPTISPSPSLIPSPSPSSDSTTNWKTYRSEKHGFAFDYSSTWQIIEATTDTFRQTSVFPNIGRDIGTGAMISLQRLSFSVPHETKLDTRVLNDLEIGIWSCFGGEKELKNFDDLFYKRGLPELVKDADVLGMEVKEIKLDDKSGKRYDHIPSLETSPSLVLIRINDNVFIEIWNLKMEFGGRKVSNDIFNHILSTFRFLD